MPSSGWERLGDEDAWLPTEETPPQDRRDDDTTTASMLLRRKSMIEVIEDVATAIEEAAEDDAEADELHLENRIATATAGDCGEPKKTASGEDATAVVGGEPRKTAKDDDDKVSAAEETDGDGASNTAKT